MRLTPEQHNALLFAYRAGYRTAHPEISDAAWAGLADADIEKRRAAHPHLDEDVDRYAHLTPYIGKRHRIPEPLLGVGLWGWRLPCPVCGETFLHHGAVEVFNRTYEDDVSAFHVIVRRDSVYEDRDGRANPSRRRDGLRIHFYCEMCDAEPILDLVQHKGQTAVAMYSSRRRAPIDPVDVMHEIDKGGHPKLPEGDFFPEAEQARVDAIRTARRAVDEGP